MYETYTGEPVAVLINSEIITAPVWPSESLQNSILRGISESLGNVMAKLAHRHWNDLHEIHPQTFLLKLPRSPIPLTHAKLTEITAEETESPILQKAFAFHENFL